MNRMEPASRTPLRTEVKWFLAVVLLVTLFAVVGFTLFVVPFLAL